MEKQLFFDIEEMPSFDVEDFIVSSSNQSAYDYIQKWPDWSSNLVFLVGESGVGKTHLANIWLEKVKGIKLLQENIDINYIGMYQNILIEDIDLIDYDLTGLFHLINAIKEKNGHIIFTSKKPPVNMDIRLDDLSSRLRSATPIFIDKPDDFLLEAILIKLFSDKKIIIEDRVTSYILQRTTRSVSEIIRLINRINYKSMEMKRRVTIPLVNQVFKEMNF